jgi:ATP synthase I chain.
MNKLDRKFFLVASLAILGYLSLLVLIIRTPALGNSGSYLSGVVVWLVPSCYFLWSHSQITTQFSNKALLRWLYLSEIIKFLLSITAFILILKLSAIKPLFFLGGYITSILILLLVQYLRYFFKIKNG